MNPLTYVLALLLLGFSAGAVSGCKTSETSWQKRNPEAAKALKRQQERQRRLLNR